MMPELFIRRMRYSGTAWQVYHALHYVVYLFIVRSGFPSVYNVMLLVFCLAFTNKYSPRLCPGFVLFSYIHHNVLTGCAAYSLLHWVNLQPIDVALNLMADED